MMILNEYFSAEMTDIKTFKRYCSISNGFDWPQNLNSELNKENKQLDEVAFGSNSSVARMQYNLARVGKPVKHLGKTWPASPGGTMELLSM